MKPQTYFAGGNTAGGFYTCFEHILPREKRKRMYYLKGGPGVGKSTLMRRVGLAAERAGERVEYFRCSSDPDSLDGVCLPDRGMAMMDGTAPHVYDPAVPGARDTLLSLGDFLDEEALRPHTRSILRIQDAISSCFLRCYRYLAAAEQVYRAAATGAEDPRRVRELAQAWAKEMPLRGGEGVVRYLFASAYTPKGYVEAQAFPEGARRTTVECPFGLHATRLLRAVAEHAAARGLNVVVLLDPLCPGDVVHVSLPEHGLVYSSGQRAQAQEGEWVEASRVFDLETVHKREQGFDRNACELLTQRGVEQLTAAKALHDELEGYYAGNMDFLKWRAMLDRVLEEQGLEEAPDA